MTLPMGNNHVEAILFACLTFCSTGLGGFIALKFKDKLRLLQGFSAGSIIAVAFFSLLPEVFSHAKSGGIMLGTAAGFLSFFALERITSMHKIEDSLVSSEQSAALGNLSAAGLALHSLFDGIAIGVGFQSGSALGLVIAFAVLLHDLSDGLNTVTVVLGHKIPIKTSIIWLLIDMSTPILGVLLTFLWKLPDTYLPWLLAYFAGFFLYIGASDLLPSARKDSSPLVGLVTLAGMILVYFANSLLPI